MFNEYEYLEKYIKYIDRWFDKSNAKGEKFIKLVAKRYYTLPRKNKSNAEYNKIKKWLEANHQTHFLIFSNYVYIKDRNVALQYKLWKNNV